MQLTGIQKQHAVLDTSFRWYDKGKTDIAY